MRKLFIFGSIIFLFIVSVWFQQSKIFSESVVEDIDNPTPQPLMLDSIPISLNKNAMSPLEGDTIKHPDIVKYAISILNLSTNASDTIDSVTIHDFMDSLVYDTAWIDSIPSGDSARVNGLGLTWTVYNLPRLQGHVIYFNGRVKSFTCEDVVPDSVIDTAYSDLSFFGDHCVLPKTSNAVVHYLCETPIKLGLSKDSEIAHPNYDTLVPGDTITYYLECKNDSAFPAKGVVIKDFLDDDVIEIIYCSNPSDTVSCANGVEWYDSCLMAYSSYYCTLTVRVGYEFKAVYDRFDTLHNWVIAYGDTTWSSDTSWSDTTTHYIYRKLDVNLDKSANPVSGSWVSRGDSILYRLWFYNDTTANSVMRDVTVTDTLDTWLDKADYITSAGTYTHPEIVWMIDSLAPGDSFVAEYYGFISTSAAFGDSILNFYRANYSYPEYTIDTTSNETVHYIGKADLDFNKSALPASGDTVLPGDTITYYLDITNTGDVPARDVVIKDTLDDDIIEIVYCSHSADTVQWNGGIEWFVDSLDAGATYYCTLSVRVGYEFKAIYDRIDTVYNWAWVTGDTLHTFDTSWSDTTTHYIYRKLDVYLGKTANPVSRSIIEAGDTIDYFLTFYNDSNANSVMRDIIVTDNLDAWINAAIQIGGTHPNAYVHPLITWTIDSLAPGDSFAGWYRGIVDTLALLGDSVINYYRIEYSDVIDSTSDTTVHYIVTERINKTAQPPAGSWVTSGDTIHYMLWYYNLGKDTVWAVSLVDTFDALHLNMLGVSAGGSVAGNVITWDIGDIAPWDSCGVWFDGEVKAGAPTGDTIPNIGVFNGRRNGFSYIEHYIMAIPGLMKEVIPSSGTIVNPGSTINYKLILNNNSDVVGMNILISDTITNVDNAWTTGLTIGNDNWSNVGMTWVVDWSIDSVPARAIDTLLYSVIVGDVVGDSVENFAILRDTLSNRTVHYVEIPDIRLNKGAQFPLPDSSIVEPGDTIKYWILYWNVGNDTVRNTEILDFIDTNFIDTCININPIASLYTQDTIRWTLGNLPPGDSGMTEYWGVVRSDVSEGKIVNLCKSFDIDTVTDTTFHFLVAEKTTKRANPSSGTIVRPGAPIMFYLSYVAGANDTIVTIVDTLDSLLSVPNIITDGGVWDGTCITWSQIVTPRSIDTVAFRANVLSSAVEGDTIYNYATFYSSMETRVEGPTIHPIGLPHIIIEKTAVPVSGSYVTSGDTIEYTLTCDNTLGTDTARNIIVIDTLSGYFSLADVVTWNVGNVAFGSVKDTTFDRIVRLNLTETAWGDTIFNTSVLFSITDTDVDTSKDITYHILSKTNLNIQKRSYELNGWELLPEFSCVYPDSSFYYDINITNVGNVAGKDLIITDTVRNNYHSVEIDSIISGPDSVWWHGNNVSISPNVIGWWVPQLDTAESINIRVRAHILPTISFKNEILDTLETIRNICWVEARNIDLDSSNIHQLYLCYECGVRIEPDTSLFVFVSESKECILRVWNTGSFTDNIDIVAFNTNTEWSISPEDTLFQNVTSDSLWLLPITLTAPDEASTDTAYVIATSVRSENIGKTVSDTAMIIITSGKRILNILVEPDDSNKTSGSIVNYDISVINNGNDYDVVNISMIELNNGWQHTLTYFNGDLLEDTDSDGKIDVGAVSPYGGVVPLLLRVTPPLDIASGVNVSSEDTLLIWGTSSHENPLDSVVCVRDSARIITELKITRPEIHNYPNPFNKDKGTTFIFVIPQMASCDLIVYTRKGEVIDVIFENVMFDIGRHTINWDARNKKGHKVGAGTYLYTFKTGNKPLIIKKLVVVPPRD